MISPQAKIQEETNFRIMRILLENPDLTQRELADMVGMSVGGLNYCLNALIDKRFVKMANLSKSKNKFKYAYALTPPGHCRKGVTDQPPPQAQDGIVRTAEGGSR